MKEKVVKFVCLSCFTKYEFVESELKEGEVPICGYCGTPLVPNDRK